MSDVSTVCSAPIVGEAQARGLDPAVLISGLGVSLSDVADPRNRMPWNAFVDFAGRATKMLGADKLEEIAAVATVEYAPRPIRRLLPRLRDSRPLFTLATRWWGPWVFRGTRGLCEQLPDGRLREIVRILPDYEACPEFFEGLRGTLRGMPRLLEQPDALVTLDHDGREAEFIITPPPRRARRWLLGRGGRVLGELGARRQRVLAERDLEELGFAREQFLDIDRRLRSLTFRIVEQSRHLGAIEELGASLVAEQDLARAGRQNEIAKVLQRQLGVEGVRVSHLEGRGSGTLGDVSGRVVGAPDRTLALLIGSRRVGLLELWGVAAIESPELIDSLSPWLAFAVEFRSMKSQVGRLTRLLSEDLRDWQEMERGLERIAERRSESPLEERQRPPMPGRAPTVVDLAGYLQGLLPLIYRRFGDEIGLDLRQVAQPSHRIAVEVTVDRDALDHEAQNIDPPELEIHYDTGYLDTLGVTHRIPEWRQSCKELMERNAYAG